MCKKKEQDFQLRKIFKWSIERGEYEMKKGKFIFYKTKDRIKVIDTQTGEKLHMEFINGKIVGVRGELKESNISYLRNVHHIDEEILQNLERILAKKKEDKKSYFKNGVYMTVDKHIDTISKYIINGRYLQAAQYIESLPIDVGVKYLSILDTDMKDNILKYLSKKDKYEFLLNQVLKKQKLSSVLMDLNETEENKRNALRELEEMEPDNLLVAINKFDLDELRRIKEIVDKETEQHIKIEGNNRRNNLDIDKIVNLSKEDLRKTLESLPQEIIDKINDNISNGERED